MIGELSTCEGFECKPDVRRSGWEGTRIIWAEPLLLKEVLAEGSSKES